MKPDATPSAGKRVELLVGCANGLFVLFLIQVGIGLILEFQYSATSTAAYSDVQHMMSGGSAMLRGFHYWSSATLIAGSFAVLVWMLFARWFNGGHNRMWLSVALLYLTSFLSQVTGNLLPFDRHGVQTSVIESGVARRMPVLGPASANFMLGGDRFNVGTIGRWHAAHIGFLVLGLIAAWLFWVGSRGSQRNRSALWSPAILAFLATLMARAPLGSQATSADFGSFDAQVSWYTWPLHGSMNLFSRISSDLGWIGSGVLPPLFALFIVAAPWLSKKLSARTMQGIFLGSCGYFLLAGIFFGGRFAPLVGNRDPVLNQPVSNGPNTNTDPVLYAKGRQLFNSNPCQSCHGADGRNGGVGPDLLGVAKKRGTDPNWYIRFIKDPTKVNPNTTMPKFSNMSDGDLRAIAEFLIHQK
ncbi:MAG TPA: cytochrome b N-terminal domain-containing protein [Fimbriimonadaceae bacterium]|nr:cytochrome b N-terminal domain-containing protein [Fimbriimonadaceae bacterium]